MSDLISRKDVIDAVESRYTEVWEDSDVDYNNGIEAALCEIKALPSADRPTDEEDQLKFYYVKSIDDYWIGMRIDNFYYADWHEGLGFVWSHSRYLPWGEHIVDENTMWKEHTYPSEPIEIPFTEWIVGFVKKYFAEREWIPCSEALPVKNGVYIVSYEDAVTWLEWFNGKWFFYPSNPAREETGNIIAWMPLPEPWRGDSICK